MRYTWDMRMPWFMWLVPATLIPLGCGRVANDGDDEVGDSTDASSTEESGTADEGESADATDESDSSEDDASDETDTSGEDCPAPPEQPASFTYAPVSMFGMPM